jgi:ketosteroid isomerase-like protein
MWRRSGRVEGAAAIAEAMRETLTDGTLSWAPIASRRLGDLGFTVGKASYRGKESWRSTYVTIWRRQADGSWKVLFDTGRLVQE